MKQSDTALITQLNKLTLPVVHMGGFPCKLVFSRYSCNGNIAISLVGAYDSPELDMQEGEPIGKATINLSPDNKPLPDTMVAIKDYAENKGMVYALSDAGIIDAHEPEGIVTNGLVDAGVWLLKPVVMLLANTGDTIH